MKNVILFLLFVAIFSCKDRQSSHNINESILSPKYAKGFWVERQGTNRELVVRQSNDASAPLLRYRLTEDENAAPKTDGITNIRIPISTIVCTSTTHIPLLDYLDESKKLIGFPSTQYISSATMRKRIDEGLVQELGIDNSLNLELLAQLQPDLLMAYNLGSDLGQLKKIQELGIPVVVNAEFLEQHPLGRAEWIKFMALFFGKEKMADSIFNWIESQYNQQKKLAQTFADQPTILTGIPYGGTWYLPGGKNYAAQFFEDAGCHYLWRDDDSNGFLKLSLESVYERASQSDFWIGVGSFVAYNDLQSTDDRFAQFAPWRNKKIYTYNNKIGPTGGNEYLELGYLRPDLILGDLIQITHPNEITSSDLYFYKPLQ